MRRTLKRFWLVSLIFFCSFASSERVKMLYNSLNPDSMTEHLAFYSLYPDTPEGQKALQHIAQFLSTPYLPLQPADLKNNLEALIQLVNKGDQSQIQPLSSQELILMEKLGSHFPNRKLKGHFIQTEEEAKALDPSEIDLARALFISQLGTEEMDRIRTYEVALDLMAIQILSKLKPNSTPLEKVNAMNQYIFYDLGFRFPPHSLYAKDIDLYTFLPSVLDSRRGVCLGVSILYITLAQRIGLELEMVTPPGHIYVRAPYKGEVINIETTARGVNPDSDIYLGVDTRSLQVRNIKEVIGLAHYNQAAVYWAKKQPELALKAYHRALPYMPGDRQLTELMGYSYLFAGDYENGNRCMQEIRNYLAETDVSPSTSPNDYLEGRVDIEGLKAVLLPVDENRTSILEKKNEILATLERFPDFKDGWHYLAICNLQLHRLKEALEALNKAHALNPHDVTTEYYLAVLNAERMNYSKAWEHLENAEKIAQNRNHHPKALEELRRSLNLLYTP